MPSAPSNQKSRAISRFALAALREFNPKRRVRYRSFQASFTAQGPALLLAGGHFMAAHSGSFARGTGTLFSHPQKAGLFRDSIHRSHERRAGLGYDPHKFFRAETILE